MDDIKVYYGKLKDKEKATLKERFSVDNSIMLRKKILVEVVMPRYLYCAKCPSVRNFSYHISPEFTKIALDLESLKSNLEYSEKALQQSFRKYAWHSTEIEGVSATNERISMIQRGTDFLETSFKFGCIERDVFLKAHDLITEDPEGETGGCFRNINVIARRMQTGRVYSGPVQLPPGVHCFPNYYKVPILMDKFIKYLNSSEMDEIHPVIRAALTKLTLVTIHPFHDGNGRLSRAILNGILRQGGFPYVTIPVTELISYTAVIEAWNVDERIDPFLDYMLFCVERSLNLYAEDAKNLALTKKD